jgi:ribosome-binding ATPase YchF (GTP1/OBG family)
MQFGIEKIEVLPAIVLHTNLKPGFIWAKVVPSHLLVEYGSMRSMCDGGKLHIERKIYLVQDNDVMHIQFNV